jgi:hypothetical protein
VSRADKGRAVARFLMSRSGIPMISWDTEIKDIAAPTPYYFSVTTDAENWRFWKHMKELPDDRIAAVIRYDKYLDSINNAVAGVPLPTLTRLLACHYETIHDRVDRKGQD